MQVRVSVTGSRRSTFLAYFGVTLFSKTASGAAAVRVKCMPLGFMWLIGVSSGERFFKFANVESHTFVFIALYRHNLLIQTLGPQPVVSPFVSLFWDDINIFRLFWGGNGKR